MARHSVETTKGKRGKDLEFRSMENVLGAADTAVAEGKNSESCVPCRIAAGVGIVEGLCEELSQAELDCREFKDLLANPDVYTLADAKEAIERMREKASGDAKTKLDFVLCLIEGKSDEACALKTSP